MNLKRFQLKPYRSWLSIIVWAYQIDVLQPSDYTKPIRFDRSRCASEVQCKWQKQSARDGHTWHSDNLRTCCIPANIICRPATATGSNWPIKLQLQFMDKLMSLILPEKKNRIGLFWIERNSSRIASGLLLSPIDILKFLLKETFIVCPSDLRGREADEAS